MIIALSALAASTLLCGASLSAGTFPAAPAPFGLEGDNPLLPLQTFTGPVGVEVDVVAHQNAAGTSGTFTLTEIPAGALVVGAWLLVDSLEPSDDVAISAVFDGNSLGSATPAAFDDVGGGFGYCLYRYDVSGLIDGNRDYPYSTAGGFMQSGDALVVVYDHPSLPVQTIQILDGADYFVSDTSSTLFEGMPCSADRATLTLFTAADEAGQQDESVTLAGQVVASGEVFDANQGLNASLVEISDVDTLTGVNTLDVTTGTDFLCLHLAILEAPGLEAMPDQGILFSIKEPNFLGPLTVDPGDLVHLDPVTDSFCMMLDLSDVTTAPANIDAADVLDDGSFVLSFVSRERLPGLVGGPDGDLVERQDLVRFIPSSLGEETEGTWEFLFDGSDVGLESSNADIDGVHVDSLDGDSLVFFFSVRGPLVLLDGTGVKDEDLLVYGGSVGEDSSGSALLLFSGRDFKLGRPGEDVDALHAPFLVTGEIFYSTVGEFRVPGVHGQDHDILQVLSPRSLFLDGDTHGLGSVDIDALIVLGDEG